VTFDDVSVCFFTAAYLVFSLKDLSLSGSSEPAVSPTDVLLPVLNRVFPIRFVCSEFIFLAGISSSGVFEDI